MNGSQMISKTIERHLPDVDGDSLTITLVFLNLAFFYSPLVGRLGQGAVMNPSTLTLRYFIGHMTAIKLFLNSAAIILGSFLGVTMVGMLLQYVPMEGVDLSPVRPTNCVSRRLLRHHDVREVCLQLRRHEPRRPPRAAAL
eukprot:CAMPEP_0114269496 /NCGR_PEP_ID=MMETSP0058-20121206/26656_1 /TAXON_ID=36894 /ORGANISM="Pyramimonas parkeae, CCMP726" /LENGTH=140 /DNA_ID=CAMNT_0001388011 /DNA_START=94 /DNA_END=516 /DNA_ORIENTATION=+